MFKKNWDFLLGKDHYRLPKSAAAMALDEWTCKAVNNQLFAVVDDKSAAISAAQPAIRVESLDDQANYYQRLLISSAIEHELNRLNWRKVSEAVYLWGSAAGIGVSMVSTKPDPVTGTMAIHLTAINPAEFFPDPSADSLETCRYVVWEPLLDMSVLRELFESKAAYVKPQMQAVSDMQTGITYKPQNNDDNLIYGPAHEFVVDSNSMLRSRKARACFVWIRDEDSVIAELRETVIGQPSEGYKCSECGVTHEDGSTETPLGPEDACPLCGGTMDRVQIPAAVKQERILRRKYPYGRLIVYSGDVLLYDGPNPLEIDQTFPFAVYFHYPSPAGSFWKTSEVSLLKTVQEVGDVTMGQVVDYVRIAANGPIITPIGEPAFMKLGNSPNQIIPMKPQNCALPRYMTPTNFNVQAVQMLINMVDRAFQVVSGRTDPVAGLPSQFPIGETQAEGQFRSFSNRLAGHRRRMDDYESTVASLVYQIGYQHYEQPIPINVQMPNAEVQSVQLEWQSLPRDVRIKVVASMDKLAHDKNELQNLALMTQPGGPLQMVAEKMPDIFIKLALKDPDLAREVMDRLNTDREINPPAPTGAPIGGPNGGLQPQYGTPGTVPQLG